MTAPIDNITFSLHLCRYMQIAVVLLLLTCLSTTSFAAEKDDRSERQIEDITLEEEPDPEDLEFIETEEDLEETPEDLYGFVNHYFIEENTTTNIAIATLSSLGLPGAGQALNQEWGKAGAHLAFWGTNAYLANYHYIVDKERHDYAESLNKANEYKSITSIAQDLHAKMSLSTRYYSAFDAYRETSRLSRRGSGRIPITKETLTELSLSPFRIDAVTKPLVFTPIFALGAYYLGRGSSHGESEELPKFVLDNTRTEEVMIYGTVQTEFVSIGEEVVFRGIVNTEMMRNLGVYPGIAVSSVIFGVSHTSAGTSSSLIATMYGMYLGFIHHYYGYQLGPGIALQFWWNSIFYIAAASRPERIHIPVASFSF